MTSKNIIWKIDKLIQDYLGLKNDPTTPISVKLTDTDLSIINNTAFKRHTFQLSWQQFCHLDIKQLNKTKKKQLGQAVGKTIAKKLTISFDNPTYRKEKSNAGK
ncbi:MAG: hypothetical protein P1U63_00690 [Coxiellaceae bacterium]|nr:hypothetical protein [Coxiellaceae bacterium]